jgi:hypothetical protein
LEKKPMGVEPPIIEVLVFGIGFAAGYGVRAWISARRRKAARKWGGVSMP